MKVYRDSLLKHVRILVVTGILGGGRSNIYIYIFAIKVAGKMIFLLHRWDMLVPRRVILHNQHGNGLL